MKQWATLLLLVSLTLAAGCRPPAATEPSTLVATAALRATPPPRATEPPPPSPSTAPTPAAPVPPATPPRPAYQSPCASRAPLAFDVEAAARLPLSISEPTNRAPTLVAGGMSLAQQLASALQPGDTLCSLPVSPQTQAVIAQARALLAAGKASEAQGGLREHLRQLTAPAGAALLAVAYFPAAPAAQANPGDWRGAARDILDLAAAAYDAGDDPEPYHQAMNAWVRHYAFLELPSADLRQALRIEAEAELLGLEDLEQAARQRVDQIGAEMIDAAIEDFDPCHADREAVRQLLNAEATAALLGVPGLEPGEARYQAVDTRVKQALAHQWNAYVRNRGLAADLLEPEPPCNVAGTLDIRIMNVCLQRLVPAGQVTFTSVPGTEPVELAGKGHISYTEQQTVAGELICSVRVDADVTLTGRLRNDAGVRRAEFTLSFTSDGRYTIDIPRSIPPVHQEGIYPLNGYGRNGFVMPWVEGSTHPAFGQTLVQFVLHISEEG